MLNETRIKEKNNQPKKPINYWKMACLLLAILIVGFIIWFYFVFFVFTTTNETNHVFTSNKKSVAFSSKTTKSNVNQLLASYIKKSTKEQKINYNIYLEDDVSFVAKIPLFGQSHALHLNFIPKIVDKGNIELKLKKSSSNSFLIPDSYILRFIKARNILPEWIEVMPSQEKIYLSFDKIKLENDAKIRMDSLDLKKDNIAFTLLLPTD